MRVVAIDAFNIEHYMKCGVILEPFTRASVFTPYATPIVKANQDRLRYSRGAPVERYHLLALSPSQLDCTSILETGQSRYKLWSESGTACAIEVLNSVWFDKPQFGISDNRSVFTPLIPGTKRPFCYLGTTVSRVIAFPAGIITPPPKYASDVDISTLWAIGCTCSFAQHATPKCKCLSRVHAPCVHVQYYNHVKRLDPIAIKYPGD